MLDAAIAAIDAHVESLRADGSIPGLVLAVTDRNGLLADRRYGWAEVAARRPVEPDTLFEIGSIGKTFAAIIVMQLVEEGRLRLDDPVVRHLPWFKVPRTGERITIRHLLSHTAGITAGIDGTPEPTFQVWRLRDLPPGSAPGTPVPLLEPGVQGDRPGHRGHRGGAVPARSCGGGCSNHWA